MNRSIATLILVLCWPWPLVLPAQNAMVKGKIEGTVQDEVGRPIWGAYITTKGAIGETYKSRSDPQGHYEVEVKPDESPFTVKLENERFNTVIRKGITVSQGQVLTLPFTLSSGGMGCPILGPPKGYDLSKSPYKVGGRVYDAQGQAIKGATVNLLTKAGSRKVGEVTTRANGDYAFEKIMLSPHFYYLRAAVPGKPEVIQTIDELNSYFGAWINFTLRNDGGGPCASEDPFITREDAARALAGQPYVCRIFYSPVNSKDEGKLVLTICDARFILRQCVVEMTHSGLPGKLVIHADGNSATQVESVPFLAGYDLLIRSPGGDVTISGVDVLHGEKAYIDVIMR